MNVTRPSAGRAGWVRICCQCNDVRKLLKVQGAIQKPSSVKGNSVAGQIVISPASLQNNMIDSWMDLNKNISDLISTPLMIAIPKPLFTRICFVTSSISADFSGGLTGQSRVTELHILLTDKNCEQILLCKLIHIFGFLYEYMEL